MIYKWKVDNLYKVPAKDAGEELNRIYQKRGKMDASDIVDESRPEDAVLHTCFEWCDPIAAEKYREHQARGICTCLITVSEPANSEPIEVRTFVHVQKTYQPMAVVINDNDAMAELEAAALRELRAFETKNRILQDRPKLREVFRAIESAIA